MAHFHAARQDSKMTLTLRIPKVGVQATLGWDGVRLSVATRIKGKIYCVYIETVRKRESKMLCVIWNFQFVPLNFLPTVH